MTAKNPIDRYNESLQGRSNTLLISDIYWAQKTLDYKFGSNAGSFANMPLEEAVQLIRSHPKQYPLHPIRVFEKQAWMDDYPTAEKVTSSGRLFTGDWATLKNGKIYTLNNRGYTLATMVVVESITVRWALWDEIYAYSYQFDSPNFGTAIWIRPNGPWWTGGMSR